MIIFLLLVSLCLSFDSSKYFKTSIETRIICTRGEGVSMFLEEEVKNYPMIIFMINQQKKDIMKFYNIAGDVIEELDISNYSLNEIVDVLDERGFRQFYKEK
ncbi:hypothetical protein CL6EHI_159660 [Entamoeba histolytica]|uniref:Selenoprotein F/M domain-containing protein n=5 Tax=Entamoeba histolytica TaxID=5759 RepID=C4LX46_ENTH1|nr:hypothetical protein EHI_159660 [Entamoeba histolytica HM-1:IMSS]EAL44857.1 hypothetical protein EHI_159660 [Entamoeba histolytica HM-1:IMSS]EMD42849.1 Hypothetical protein EHI5A_072440 [Entamoeba histolytica KU27]ENY62969.1 hypothetical protein EHI7A_190750 [Entamoeba histolytica HM-1:IMSS-A]GAT93301.1 hypothetical protein CL6EHI_159660 [Entamoeba histolytica]|eukprot:XP_650244.1 hypothetical protein EHI_159660 [Entamoeba histolytica HM-1:IMSS]